MRKKIESLAEVKEHKDRDLALINCFSNVPADTQQCSLSAVAFTKARPPKIKNIVGIYIGRELVMCNTFEQLRERGQASNSTAVG